MQKIVLITGVAGQDGSYPANLLLEKSNIVHQSKRSSLKRHSSSLNTERVDRRTSLTAYVLVTGETGETRSVRETVQGNLDALHLNNRNARFSRHQ